MKLGPAPTYSSPAGRCAWPRTSQAVRLDIGTDPAEKADTAMHDDNDDPDYRINTAEQLARLDRRAGAEAILTIATDDGIDPEYRINAAEQLPELDPRAAAEAFRAIATDDGIDPEYRINAAEQLAELHSRPTV
jgi:hypothetical protein